jgi:hypothetical protein
LACASTSARGGATNTSVGSALGSTFGSAGGGVAGFSVVITGGGFTETAGGPWPSAGLAAGGPWPSAGLAAVGAGPAGSAAPRSGSEHPASHTRVHADRHHASWRTSLRIGLHLGEQTPGPGEQTSPAPCRLVESWQTPRVRASAWPLWTFPTIQPIMAQIGPHRPP